MMKGIGNDILCKAVAFHSTTKKNMKNIMREGIKPGGEGGWIDIAKAFLADKELSKKRVFTSGSFDDGIENYYPDLPSLDTVALVCLPSDNENENAFDASERCEILSGEIPPENIIGCLDIVKDERNNILNIYDDPAYGAPNRYRYIINKNCKY